MQVSHLHHSDAGIYCIGCGQQFEVSSRALMNPHRLLEWKEGIAAQHTCKPHTPRKQRIRVCKARGDIADNRPVLADRILESVVSEILEKVISSLQVEAYAAAHARFEKADAAYWAKALGTAV